MNVELNKQWATKKNYGLIDPMIKELYKYVDFANVKTIYDIGSRDALQSQELSNAFPDATIYAFEPNPEAFITCIENAKGNNKIKLNQLAVSNIDGEISFYAQDLQQSYDVNIGVSSMFKLMDQTPNGWRWVQKEIKVPSITLNNFVSQGNPIPDLIWIDIQGAELLAFQGASTILPKIKAIFTEAGKIAYYHGHNMFAEIDTYLTSFGFHNVLEVPGHRWESDFLYVR